jgi:hypothetical protein
LGKSKADYAAEARAAQEAASPQLTAQARLSAEDAQWRSMAEEACRYGTHGNQLAIKQVFDNALASGADWRRVYEACLKTVNLFKRQAAVSRW